MSCWTKHDEEQLAKTISTSPADITAVNIAILVTVIIVIDKILHEFVYTPQKMLRLRSLNAAIADIIYSTQSTAVLL